MTKQELPPTHEQDSWVGSRLQYLRVVLFGVDPELRLLQQCCEAQQSADTVNEQ